MSYVGQSIRNRYLLGVDEGSSPVEKGEKCCDVLLSLSWVMLVAVVEFVCFMTAQSKIASVGIYTGVVIVML